MNQRRIASLIVGFMSFFTGILLLFDPCCRISAEETTDSSLYTTYASDNGIQLDRKQPDRYDAQGEYGGYLYSDIIKYRTYLETCGKIAFSGNWSAGILHTGTGDYERISRVLFMNNKELDPDTHMVISEGWDMLWGTTESFFAQALAQYTAGERVSYVGQENAGMMFLSSGSGYATAHPVTSDTVYAYEYVSPQAGRAILSYAEVCHALSDSNARICILVDGRMIFPVEDGDWKNPEDWYPIVGKDAEQINALLAEKVVNLTEGSAVHYCLSADRPASEENANGLTLNPALTMLPAQASEPSFDGASITLGDAFAVNYYVVPPAGADATGVILNGEFLEGTLQADGSVKVSVGGIAAKEMADPLTVIPASRYGEEYMTGSADTRTPAELLDYYMGTEEEEVAVATLNYIAAAQMYFSYRTDTLVNAALREDQKVWKPEGTYTDELTMTGAATAVRLRGITLVLEDSVAFRLYAVCLEGDGDAYYAQISTNGFVDVYTVPLSPQEGMSSGEYEAIFRGITPANWGTVYSLRVVNGQGEPVSKTVTYSVTTYAVRTAEIEEAPPALRGVTEAMQVLYEKITAYCGER